MKRILNYNIHDFLKFKIVREKEYGLRDLINLNFSFFEVKDVDNPDITLNIGKFKPTKENCYLVDHKYYIKENYFYCKDSEGKAKWEVEITGFEDRHITINFNGKISGFKSLINPDFIAQGVLLRIIEYKLSRKGYFLAHAAGISKDDEAYVFAGRGGTFKTSFCMDFIRRGGFEFLGDDRVILHKDKVFSFPMGLRVFGFMCDHLPNEDSWNIFNKVRFAKYLWNKKGKKGNLIKVGEQSKLKNLFFMVRTNKDRVAERKIPYREVVDKLITNNRLEYFISLGDLGINSGPFLRYALAYFYIFPYSRTAREQEESGMMLRNILENVQSYGIEIPNDYNLDIFKRVKGVIEDLVKK